MFPSCVCRLAFTAVYLLEALVKTVSRGLCVGKFTYLRNPWNWPDVAIIAAAYEGTVVASLRSAFVFQASAYFVVFLFPFFFGFVAIFKS